MNRAELLEKMRVLKYKCDVEEFKEKAAYIVDAVETVDSYLVHLEQVMEELIRNSDFTSKHDAVVSFCSDMKESFGKINTFYRVVTFPRKKEKIKAFIEFLIKSKY
jgi:hypothetical protein